MGSLKKDFDGWSEQKKRLQKRDISSIYFYEREIWWCSLGVNIGFEQDGTNETWERPIVILKKYNPYIFLTLPLSTTEKRGKYYVPIGRVEERSAIAIISQLRLLDSRRLINRIGILDEDVFYKLVERIVEVNFSLEKSSPPLESGGEP